MEGGQSIGGLAQGGGGGGGSKGKGFLLPRGMSHPWALSCSLSSLTGPMWPCSENRLEERAEGKRDRGRRTRQVVVTMVQVTHEMGLYEGGSGGGDEGRLILTVFALYSGFACGLG